MAIDAQSAIPFFSDIIKKQKWDAGIRSWVKFNQIHEK
jgi:hypothetical protein